MNINNTLLEHGEFVNYPSIKPEEVVPAIEIAVTEAHKHLEKTLSKIEAYRLNKDSLTFNSVIFPLIEAEQIVSRVWSPIGNLLALDGTPELRDAAQKARPLVVNFHNDVVLDPRLFELLTLYSDSSEGRSLSGPRRRYISNTIRDLKLSGASLDEYKKSILREYNLKIAELSRQFSDNATDSKYELLLTKDDDLLGLPEEVIIAAQKKADIYREKLSIDQVPSGAAIINLDYPSYVPFMRYSERGDLRKKLALQYMQKGTEQASGGLLSDKNDKKSLDNQKIIKDLCQAKTLRAKLLGFNNYAEVSLSTKMAKDPNKVLSFLKDLAVKARPVAQKEYKALLEFQNNLGYKNTESNPNKIYSWDREFLAEKLKKVRFDFDSSETKPYFELRQTLNGMFSIIETLFGATFTKENSIPTWHSDVEVYQVLDKSGEILGTIYFDLFPRDTKRQGAWVNPLVSSHIDSKGNKHQAQCVLACNLTPPDKDSPSLLSSDEARTLFHEMGHALHQIFSTVELEPLSGLNVAYDFVELPSQLFENFFTEETSLKSFAKHYKTGADIPQTLVDKMKQAERFLSGMLFIRQLEFGLLDMSIYTKTDTDDLDVDRLFKEIVTNYGVFDYIPGTHFPCSFSHIFGGGYSAGYYSYKWSEVLEADAFTRFKEAGVLSAKIGEEYRHKILSKGDSQDPMELYTDFMGREPNQDALLERLKDTI